MTVRAPGWWLAVAAAVAMAVVVAAGLWILGTPSHQRALRLDAHRVQNLGMVANFIDLYWRQHKSLPPDLSHLEERGSFLRDPLTQAPYGYAVTGKTTYRLCATFQAATPKGEDMRNTWPYVYTAQGWRWSHPAGRHCFERSVKQ